MDATTQQLELPNDGRIRLSPEYVIEAKRESLRQSLDAIAFDVGMLLRDAELGFQVGLTIPNPGRCLVGMV